MWIQLLPVHDVHLACRELVRCAKLGAVDRSSGRTWSNDHYWHSNYWDPLYRCTKSST